MIILLIHLQIGNYDYKMFLIEIVTIIYIYIHQYRIIKPTCSRKVDTYQIFIIIIINAIQFVK